MADAPDDNVERLKTFNDTLSQVMIALTRDTISLQADLKGFETIETQWAKLVDAESSDAFTAMLHDLDTILDEGVEASATAATNVSALASEKESDDLAAANGRSDAEAAAFESLAGASVTGVGDATTSLDLGAVALSDQAVYAGVALGRLEAAATTAFASVRESTAEIVSDLAKEMEGAGNEAREHGEGLDSSVLDLSDALGTFTESITAATGQLASTHAELAGALSASYENWESSAKETGARVREALAQHLRGYAELLETHGNGLGTDQGAEALDEALNSVETERNAWSARIAGRAEFLSTLPGTAVALTEAQAIAERAAGVLNVL